MLCEKFDKEELSTIFGAGYRSHDALCVLIKMKRMPRDEFVDGDIQELVDILNVFKDFEKGRKAIEDFRHTLIYKGSDQEFLFMHSTLIKLLSNFSNKSDDEIEKEFTSNIVDLELLIKYLRGEIELSPDKKGMAVEKIMKFLNVISRCYRNAFYF